MHSHSYYSFCGGDKPEEIVEAAIAGGIELFGITDHSYGIGNGRKNVFNASKEEVADDYERTLLRYYDHINLVKEKYADRIRILCGIEIGLYKIKDSHCLIRQMFLFLITALLNTLTKEIILLRMRICLVLQKDVVVW